jgi:hypothetical protein
MLIKTPWGHVIVEVDEHQHAGYHGELDRMQCIRNALATRTAFLRINPDRYEDDNGVIWESVLVKDEVDNEEVMRRWKILHPIVGRMLCDWAPDTYVFYNTQGRDAMCDTPSDGAVDNNLIVSSSKDVVLSAPTGNVVATTDKFVLLSGSHAARMLISDSNELVFELKDDTSGSFLPVARFATTI